jgi:hypothetical protein
MGSYRDRRTRTGKINAHMGRGCVDVLSFSLLYIFTVTGIKDKVKVMNYLYNFSV